MHEVVTYSTVIHITLANFSQRLWGHYLAASGGTNWTGHDAINKIILIIGVKVQEIPSEIYWPGLYITVYIHFESTVFVKSNPPLSH